jgi:hypothetical protein
MTTMQWIALAIGLLLLVTRAPAVLWPGPYRRTALDLLQGSGRTVIRLLGVFLWVLVVTVVVLLLRTLTLLQGVLLILAVLFAAAGAVAVAQPDGYRLFSERMLARLPDWALRCAALVGVALGGWLVYLSLKSA